MQRGTEASDHCHGTQVHFAPGIWTSSRVAAAAPSPGSKQSGRLLQATLCKTVLNFIECPCLLIYVSELDGVEDTRRVEYSRVEFEAFR